MRNFASFFRSGIVTALIALPVVVSAAEGAANGIFLIATNALRDPNFRETVVLVTQPQNGGPFGVIINRPLDHRLADALPEYEALKGRQDVIHYGGPVARDGLVFLVRSEGSPPRAIRVLKDVYITADREAIESVLSKPNSGSTLRAYAGHSGWAPGQLQNEISRGSWYVLPADAGTVFEKDIASIWPELSKRAALRPTGIAE
jgi:putative transcriptional regulator